MKPSVAFASLVAPAMNDIAPSVLAWHDPNYRNPCAINRTSGALVLMSNDSNATVAVGLIA